MSYKYTHFIKQNVAPIDATKIGIYDSNGNRVGGVSLGTLAPPTGEKSYSFGLISDLHFSHSSASWSPEKKFESALSYFESNGCKMCMVSGDLTQTGYYRRTSESDASTTYYDEAQLLKYEELSKARTIPIYEISGNHESYYGMPITNNLDKWKAHTGEESLHYYVEQGNDLFIMLGQPKGNTPMTDDALQWLYTILEANRNKRCFIFVHPDISSGNPLGIYSSNRIFDWWGTKTTAFKNLLKHYKNTIIFHGHSHMKFESQELDAAANYSEKDGFKSVHVPSLGMLKAVINGSRENDYQLSQCYMVDVYPDCIVLNGLTLSGTDFKTIEKAPLGTYKIDTTIQTIPANTFTDTTGIIQK